MFFTKSAIEPNYFDQAYYFCYLDQDILLENGAFPLLTEENEKEFRFKDKRFFGSLNGRPCFSVSKEDKTVSNNYHWVSLREFFLDAEKELSNIAGYGKQILDWNVNFRYCGRCSQPTVVLAHEHARKCEKCQLINYPRISPAVITAVIKDDQILLARGLNYRNKEMFSVLAGFLEPGESLEDAVKREIKEEVGIEVTNIRYFKSQSWPFPDSLMIAFTADYLSGSIEINKNEITEAKWFKADALPKIPTKRSISSELIQWFANQK